jgi:acyl-homoserine lactone acylase PvdQ
MSDWLASFARAMDRLEDEMGSLDAQYGEKFRVGRDDASWPVSGGGDFGARTLRSVSYEKEKDDFTQWGRSGQTSTQIVVLTEPIQSWWYIPIGESDNPDSPHYRDLAEKAFSPAQLQPTWWLPQDLVGHIESRTVLENALSQLPQLSSV